MQQKTSENNAQQFKYSFQQRQPRKSTWINRNPRLFVCVTTTAALCIFFSRPLYDIFFRTDIPNLNEIRKEKPRFG